MFIYTKILDINFTHKCDWAIVKRVFSSSFIFIESLRFCHYDCLPKREHAKWNLIRVGRRQSRRTGYILPHWPTLQIFLPPLRSLRGERNTLKYARTDKVCGWNWFHVKQIEREREKYLLVSLCVSLCQYKNYNPQSTLFFFFTPKLTMSCKLNARKIWQKPRVQCIHFSSQKF